MAWVACDKDGEENIYQEKPIRRKNLWDVDDNACYKELVGLPKGSIKKLIGRELKWEDDCVELKEG